MYGQWNGSTTGSWWGAGITAVISQWIMKARRRGRR